MRLAALFVASLVWAGAAMAEDITSAQYDGPTTRYPHGVLGDDIEHARLTVRLASGRRKGLTLPDHRVFEDTEPRLFDVDLDGEREVIVVESDAQKGARLAIYGSDGLEASTPFIGTRFRWLAPAGVGAADLDGDGLIEVAFVDRPHLAKTLRIFRFQNGKLRQVGDLPGVTNHRIGEVDIAGGIRDCGRGPEVIVADAAWQRVLAITFDGQSFKKADLGPHRGRKTFTAAMACKL